MPRGMRGIVHNNNMNKKMMWWAIAAIAVIVVVLAVASRSDNASGKTIKIGVILPLTGDLSVTGEKMYNGVRLAADKLPANVKLIYQDDHSNVTDGVTAATELLNVENVDMILGVYNPDETIAVAPLAKAKGRQVFSTNFCDDAFVKLGNVFCGYPNAAKQLMTALPMIKKVGIKKFALVDSNSSFGIDSKNGMNAMAGQGGYQVVMDDFLPSSPARDYHTEALKVVKSGADAVFAATDDPADSLTLMKDLYTLGFKGTRITFVDTDDKYLAQFGASANGTFAPGITPSSFAPDFTAAYQTKFNVAPDYAAALGYDFVRSITAALEANHWSADGIAGAVVSTSYADPAITGFHFLSDRTVDYQLELWQAQNGHYAKATGY